MRVSGVFPTEFALHVRGDWLPVLGKQGVGQVEGHAATHRSSQPLGRVLLQGGGRSQAVMAGGSSVWSADRG